MGHERGTTHCCSLKLLVGWAMQIESVNVHLWVLHERERWRGRGRMCVCVCVRGRERERFTPSIQPAMAYEHRSLLVSRPLYRWPV